MKKIAFAFIAALAVMSFAGCKKKGGDDMKEAMAKMESFQKDMCACKDKACAEKVDTDMKAYGEKMKGKADKDAKISEADQKKMMEVMTEYAKCQQTAMGTGMPDPAAAGTPPAGDTAAPPAGDTAAPAGDTAAPAGDTAAPAGDEAAPAGDEKKE